MDTRRAFIKKAALLSGGVGLAGMLPASIQRAMAINPLAGTTYLDAEHVVILMQENRSFDHCYGALKGVRGFNDPRAIQLPDKNRVWLQTNAKGETYAPFRLDIKGSNATWMNSLPHSWANQVDARNHGKHNRWLDVKRSGHKEYADMPLTMGYYNREDIPFYYALADAFTVCDQNFCSSLTGTTPNRLYLWSGTVRHEPNENSKAHVRNEDVDYDKLAGWTTFPERLEDNSIPWKIYQNEINLPSGFDQDEDAWLANFSDNPIEWFEQYNVKFSPAYQEYIRKLVVSLPDEIKTLQAKLASLPATDKDVEKMQKQVKEKQYILEVIKQDIEKWTPENFDKLSQREKNLHTKAFSTNKNDPHYRELTTLKYSDNGVERELAIPKGDVLYEFRDDVQNGKLPTVSWIVAPENFSDHPGAPWYGAWYLSEVMDILTKNPAVWQKTIFILCYDENDGYFDHVPPFVAPHPDRPGTGKVSKGIDTGAEQVSMALELERKKTHPDMEPREGPIGLGYRVPLVIASPWSRGGNVCSEVFDHTSIIQFLEKFLSAKTGKKIEETNITSWRRTVCGDLTSIFKPYEGEKINALTSVSKEAFIESIHKAKFKKLPSAYRQLSKAEIELVNNTHFTSLLPQQEKGIKPSCAIPYQLMADGRISDDKKTFAINFGASKEIFKDHSSGAPFIVYAPGKISFKNEKNDTSYDEGRSWNYAIAAGDSLNETWNISDFENNTYHLRLYGPNGFFREFNGNTEDPLLDIQFDYLRDESNTKLTGNIKLRITNLDKNKKHTVEVKDLAYKSGNHIKVVDAGASGNIILDLSRSYGWYDFGITVKGSSSFFKQYAGHVETGKASFSDPAMGKVEI